MNGRFQYLGDTSGSCTLRINRLLDSDQAGYFVILKTDDDDFISPHITLTVQGRLHTACCWYFINVMLFYVILLNSRPAPSVPSLDPGITAVVPTVVVEREMVSLMQDKMYWLSPGQRGSVVTRWKSSGQSNVPGRAGRCRELPVCLGGTAVQHSNPRCSM